MIANPEDRRVAIEKLLDAAGGKLHSYYVTMGESDFLVVSEAPDLETVGAVLLTAGATGGVCNLATHPAMTTTDAMAAMKKAGSLIAGFKPAGA